MTKDEFVEHLKSASQNGSLLTPKHDPNNLSTVYTSYRTVISHDAASKLDWFIDSKQFKVVEFENTKYPNSPIYMEIEPNPSTLSPAGSGVPPSSPMASTVVDRIIAVSGQNLGWHIFAEDSQEIAKKEKAGELKRLGELK